MSRTTDVTLRDLAEWCDAFTIGGTKAGALCGEAVVFPRHGKPAHFLTFIKKRGALLAKGRLLGVQFDALFTEDLYYRIGKYAIDKAEELKQILSEKGLSFAWESPTNQQFVVLTNAQYEAMKKQVQISFWERPDEEHTIVRLATSWATAEEDLAALRAVTL